MRLANSEMMEFLSRLMSSATGKQVLAERDQELFESRRIAAAKLLETENDEAIKETDARLLRKNAEVASLAEHLTKAQQA
jgi:hypothetical protein